MSLKLKVDGDIMIEFFHMKVLLRSGFLETILMSFTNMMLVMILGNHPVNTLVKKYLL